MVTQPGSNAEQTASLISHDELTDIRALQRTFDGAYTRTALAQLSYSILILRLFERKFYWCGLAYTIMAVQLIGVAVYRYNLAVSNNERWEKVEMSPLGNMNDSSVAQQVASSSRHEIEQTSSPMPKPIFRRTFRTAGTVVAVATAGTLILEIALVVLVLNL